MEDDHYRQPKRSGHRDPDRNRDRDYDRGWDRERGRDRSYSHSSHGKGGRGNDYDRDRGRDSFSRINKFPPSFDSSSADYVFDPMTGYFYEEHSDYFYDPKSKLYYSNEKKTYYTHEHEKDVTKMSSKSCAKEDAHFRIFDEAEGRIKMRFVRLASNGSSNGGTGDMEIDAGQALVLQTDSKKMSTANKISINIKQKVKKGSGSTSSSIKKKHSKQNAKVDKCKQSQAQKARQEDMEKWSQRVKEVEAEDAQEVVGLTRAEFGSAKGKVIRTKSGKLVCLLCKRKFTSMEKLIQHEKLSELHKYNVSRLKKGRDSMTSVAKKYVDRAHQRRVMYEADQALVAPILTAPADIMLAPSLTKARCVVATETVRPEDNLGGSNIGNKMLQKLGWEGGSLGRTSDGTNDKAGFEDKAGENGTSHRGSDRLKQDWERIESLAAQRR